MMMATVVALGLLPGAAVAASASASSSAPSSSVEVRGVATGVADFEFASYSADYYLARNDAGHSTLKTVETFVANFPSIDQNRGMIRSIPNDYDGVPLVTQVQSVVDENGQPVPYEITVRDGFTEAALGTDEFVHGRTSYTITYTQENVVRDFSDTNSDEFYWDTNGVGFAQPFGSVSARVHVDPALTEFLTDSSACYYGAQSSTDQCEIVHTPDAEGDTFTSTVQNLGAGENLTVVVGFTLGTFVQEPAQTIDGNNGTWNNEPWITAAPPWWVELGGIAMAILAALGTAFTIVWRFVKPASSKGSGIIIPQYTVPQGINLLEASELIGRANAGVAAQIVSFAVRGKLRILDYPVTNGGAQFTLQLLDASGLDDQELALLTALFEVGPSTEAFQALGTTGLFDEGAVQQMSERANRLVPGTVREVGLIDDTAARAVKVVQSGVTSRLTARGLTQKRSSLAGIFIALSVFLMGFASVALFFYAFTHNSFSGWSIASTVIAFLAFILSLSFAWRPAVPTANGAELNDYLLGMRDYLQLAEAERFRMLQSPEGAQRMRLEQIDIRHPAQKVKLYEKLLPFAVMWGVEKEWVKELAFYFGAEAPQWFVSTGTFDAMRFSSAMSTISRTAVARATPAATTSSWSGSSGGSFSGGSHGGGFSGGGGGGGGGGGR